MPASKTVTVAVRYTFWPGAEGFGFELNTVTVGLLAAGVLAPSRLHEAAASKTARIQIDAAGLGTDGSYQAGAIEHPDTDIG